ncbi:hypothetical protein HDU76_005259 [Blyttiomyces sp. JEL0837]|nr:hypothetical protein HDU76_005259 [Blyttiomyces sp. JEL0837]
MTATKSTRVAPPPLPGSAKAIAMDIFKENGNKHGRTGGNSSAGSNKSSRKGLGSAGTTAMAGTGAENVGGRGGSAVGASNGGGAGVGGNGSGGSGGGGGGKSGLNGNGKGNGGVGKGGDEELGQRGQKKITAAKKLKLGVMYRTPMGEYIAEKDEALSSLAKPLPGPLDYDPKLPPSGVQYSILGKHASLKEVNIGPGPNKYNVRGISAIFDDPPHWSFGMKLDDVAKVTNENPSPFAYDNNHKAFGMEGNAYTMSGRFSTGINETPGPDRYFPSPNSHPTAGASPKFSFGLKIGSKGLDINQSIKTLRFQLIKTCLEETTPGPQDYEVSVVPPCAPAAPSYTIRPRVGIPVFTDKEDYQRPGFNEYNVKIPISEKAASLKGWYKESKALKTPGPANYIMPNALFCGPQYSLTGRNVPYEDEDYYVAPPGPADYDPDPKLTLDKAPKYSLGNRWRDQRPKNKEVPGPGTYQPKDRQIRGNDGPKVTLKGRHSKSTPGPADYYSAQAGPVLSPAQLARLEKKRELSQKERPVENTPGPADYRVRTMNVTKPCGPKYSLATRIASRVPDQTPGPNAYRANPRLDGPRISMKSRMSPFVLVFPSQRVDTLRV